MFDFQLSQKSIENHEPYTFTPGQKFNFIAKFSEIPHKYHLQICDKNNNTRLNRYGKGSEMGIKLTWPIPKTIRKRHLGIWKLIVRSDTENFSLFFSVKDYRDFFNCE
jgi:hypothetical protein